MSPIYGLLNLLFYLFNFLFMFILMRLSSKTIIFNANLQNSLQDLVDYRILGCQTLRYKNGDPLNIRQYFNNRPLLFRSEIGIFDICFKRLQKDSFEDLQINSNLKFKTRATKSHKMTAH